MTWTSLAKPPKPAWTTSPIGKTPTVHVNNAKPTLAIQLAIKSTGKSSLKDIAASFR